MPAKKTTRISQKVQRQLRMTPVDSTANSAVTTSSVQSQPLAGRPTASPLEGVSRRRRCVQLSGALPRNPSKLRTDREPAPWCDSFHNPFHRLAGTCWGDKREPTFSIASDQSIIRVYPGAPCRDTSLDMLTWQWSALQTVIT